jgi:energy-coupling factor transport system permease protein
MARSPLHALTWTVWAAAAAICVESAPSAAYCTVVLLVCTLVVEWCGRRSALSRAYWLFVALGAAFGMVRVVITALTTHTGVPLFRLPIALTLPKLLGGFTVGGPVAREVVLQSLAEAYTITVFIAVFAAWNAVVSHHEALRAVPRAFHEPALILTVAIAFVPSTLAALRAVREAERARTGGAARRRGALRRRALPVLETGLERAMSLAESMDARGLGHAPPLRAERTSGWCALGSLMAAGGALVALVSRASAAAVVLFVAAGALAGAALAAGARAQRSSRYRPRSLTALDGIVMALSALAPVAVVIAAASGDASLHWAPGRLELPPVHLAILLSLAALVAPLLAARRSPVRAPAVVREPAWTR